MKAKKMLFVLPAILLGIVIVTFVGGQIVRLLWNWLLPPLFGWPQITFWQALALLVLCRILVGGGGRFGRGRRWGGSRKFGDRLADRIVDRVAERLEGMTPEERERFRQRVREKWGADPPPSEAR